MQNNTPTFEIQTLPFGEEELMSLQVDSPASLSVKPASAWEQRMNATCGPKCFVQFNLFDQDGSWARTFTELLIGRKAWCSSRCVLTWNEQVMKHNRTLYRLRVSALPTNGTGCGSWRIIKMTCGKEIIVDSENYEYLNQWKWKLHKNGYAYRTVRSTENGKKWKTILMHRIIVEARKGEEVDHMNRNKLDNRKENLRIVSHWENSHNRKKGPGVRRPNGRNKWFAQIYIKNQRIHLGCFDTKEEAMNARLIAEKNYGLLPTAQTQGLKMCNENGKTVFYPLELLPTPTASDFRGARSLEGLEIAGRSTNNSLADTFAQTGKSSQLNPLFVAEMMGFPPDHTVKPFQKSIKWIELI